MTTSRRIPQSKDACLLWEQVIDSDTFEDVAVLLLQQCLSGLAPQSARRYGKSGQAQEGTDVWAEYQPSACVPPRTTLQAQAKCYYGTQIDIRAICDKFKGGRLFATCKTFIIIAVGDHHDHLARLTATTTIRHYDEYRKNWAKLGVDVLYWSTKQIEGLLRTQHNIVEQYWGRDTVESFCSTYPLLTPSMHLHPVGFVAVSCDELALPDFMYSRWTVSTNLSPETVDFLPTDGFLHYCDLGQAKLYWGPSSHIDSILLRLTQHHQSSEVWHITAKVDATTLASITTNESTLYSRPTQFGRITVQQMSSSSSAPQSVNKLLHLTGSDQQVCLAIADIFSHLLVYEFSVAMTDDSPSSPRSVSATTFTQEDLEHRFVNQGKVFDAGVRKDLENAGLFFGDDGEEKRQFVSPAAIRQRALHNSATMAFAINFVQHTKSFLSATLDQEFRALFRAIELAGTGMGFVKKKDGISKPRTRRVLSTAVLDRCVKRQMQEKASKALIKPGQGTFFEKGVGQDSIGDYNCNIGFPSSLELSDMVVQLEGYDHIEIAPQEYLQLYAPHEEDRDALLRRWKQAGCDVEQRFRLPAWKTSHGQVRFSLGFPSALIEPFPSATSAKRFEEQVKANEEARKGQDEAMSICKTAAESLGDPRNVILCLTKDVYEWVCQALGQIGMEEEKSPAPVSKSLRVRHYIRGKLQWNVALIAETKEFRCFSFLAASLSVATFGGARLTIVTELIQEDPALSLTDPFHSAWQVQYTSVKKKIWTTSCKRPSPTDGTIFQAFASGKLKKAADKNIVKPYNGFFYHLAAYQTLHSEFSPQPQVLGVVGGWIGDNTRLLEFGRALGAVIETEARQYKALLVQPVDLAPFFDLHKESQ